MTLAIVIATAHVFGLVASFAALMGTRTSQGTIGWIVSLNLFPYLAVPAYWVFGRSKFRGYIVARKDEDANFRRALTGVREGIEAYRRELPDEHGRVQAVELLAQMPFLGGNAVELLIDGEATFESIFAGMDRAEHYLLVQFYIVADDELGRALKDRMIAKAGEGVRVMFLYDEIGSGKLPRSYLTELRDAKRNDASFFKIKWQKMCYSVITIDF